MGRWRKLHNEELQDFYSSPSVLRIVIVKDVKIGSTRSANGPEEEQHGLLLRISEGQRPLGRPRRRCMYVYNNKMDLAQNGLV
jgi:hypothetical protein